MDKMLLLSDEVQTFIKEHESDDLPTLILQRKKYPDLPLNEIVDQIKSRLKAKKKLPTWYRSDAILYPKPISIEQSSSEISAEWKAKYIGKGKTGIDLTGGFGVDSYFFANSFERWTHVEPNAELQGAVKHNFSRFGIENTVFANCKSEEYLKDCKEQVDFIYIDPDRRPSASRVAGLKDSRPDITNMLTRLKQISPQILIKASPMIDLKAGIAELESVNRVIVLSIDNEVKEVLFHLDFTNEKNVSIRCVNIKNDKIDLLNYANFGALQEEIIISQLKAYLYEPNAAILKAGAQDALAKQKNLTKLHRNTNLFTNDQLINDFPGRVFKTIADLPYNKKEISSHIRVKKANLSTRNFIDTPEQMKRKLGLQDGGNIYLFGYRNFENRNKVVICEKVN